MYPLKWNGQGARGVKYFYQNETGKRPNKVDASTRMEWAKSNGLGCFHQNEIGKRSNGLGCFHQNETGKRSNGVGCTHQNEMGKKPNGSECDYQRCGMCVVFAYLDFRKITVLNRSDCYPNTRVGSCNFAVLMKSDQVREDPS